MVYRYLSALCRNPDLAEELTQETFFRAVKYSKSFDGNVKVTTWLCKIAKNVYFTYLQKNKNSIVREIREDEMTCGEDISDKENCRDIYKAIHRLDEPYREIILLRIHTDLNFSDIGNIFGKSDSWARVTFYRGKEKLRKLLEESE